MRVIAWLVSLLSLHGAVNSWRRPAPRPLTRTVSVLVPARDEAARLPALLGSLGGDYEVLVLDDSSTDGTAQVASALGARVIPGEPLPAGWLGKSWACHQLAAAASGDVLVFVDADVVLKPGAVEATVAELDDLDLVCPYPRQVGTSRLTQPLLQWSILTFLPLPLALRSSSASLSAANGQLLAVRRSTYDRAGGHAAVRDQVLEDVGLLRAVKAVGGRGGVVNGTHLATTRMYDDWPALAEGYSKWLGTLPPYVPAGLFALYVLPWLRPGRAARIACAAGVLGRAATARRTGSPVADGVLHPVSIVVLCGLWVRSRARPRTWKGRAL